MGILKYPRSIKGKLILVFILAIGPMLGVHVWDRVEDRLDSEQHAAQYQFDAASAISCIVSQDIAYLEAQHKQRARELENAQEPEKLLKRWNSTGNGRISFTLAPSIDVAAPASKSDTGISSTFITDDKEPLFTLINDVNFKNNKRCRLITKLPVHSTIQRLRGIDTLHEKQVCAIADSNYNALIWNGKHNGQFNVQRLSGLVLKDKTGKIALPRNVISSSRYSGQMISIPRTGWKVLAMQPRSYMGPERQIGIIIGVILAAIIGLVIVCLMGSELAQPLRRLALAAGALAVGDYRKRVQITTNDEMQILGESFNTLGDSLIERESIMRGQAEMLAGMVEAARVASSSLDIEECGKAIAKVLCTHLGANGAVVFRKDDVNGGVKSCGRHGKRPYIAWKRLAMHTTNSGEYLVISEQRTKNEPESESESLLVGIPLSIGAHTIGAIVAHYNGVITREHLKLGSVRADVLAAFGVHAAAALGNAEAYSLTEKYSAQLEDWVAHQASVMRVTDAISPSLNLDETLAALATETASVMEANMCIIFLPDRDNNLISRACCSDGKPFKAKYKLAPDEAITGKAYSEKRYVACLDFQKLNNDTITELTQASGLQSALSTPLIIEDQAIGAITVYRTDQHDFTPQEIRLLISIGLHAAVIVRNASLYTRESSIAETLQKGLVSEAPEECMGLHFGSRYIAALDEARVGGDFYDITRLPNGKVGVIIGDVSGKGLKAAIHLAACKYMIKALMYLHQDDPSRVLRELNESLNYYFDLSFFVTVFYAVIDPKEGTIQYANAGHPPALLISNDGKMQTRLSSTGIPAGSGYGCKYETRSIQASPTDVLLLYTDGVTDAAKDGQLLGVEGLQRMLFLAESFSVSDLLDYVCKQIGDTSDWTTKDDIALLAISFDSVSAIHESATGGTGEYEYSLTARTA